MKFENLGVAPKILDAIKEMGFENPTEVQEKAIPYILDKHDVIVMSKTGSGKTAVYGIPLLQLIDPKETETNALILTPTRELAVQVDNDLKKISKYLGHKTLAVYGKHNINTEKQKLQNGVSIISGTPGRVFDHIASKSIKTNKIKYLVLDEADRMLDMGFIDQVVRIIKTLPRDRITLLFSATIPSQVKRLCKSYMREPVTIEIESATKTVDTIKQQYFRVERPEKLHHLNRLLLFNRPESCLIFCNTKIGVDRVKSYLSKKGYDCRALHGDIPQGRRMQTIQQFKQGKFHILAATDVAARGLHIEDLSLVINFDIPEDKDSYVHRIGRTGRAGNGGHAINLVTRNDIMSLYELEEHIGTLIEEADLPSDSELSKNKELIDKWIQYVKYKRSSQQPSTAKKKSPNKKNNSNRKPYNKNKSGSASRQNKKSGSNNSRKPYTKPSVAEKKPKYKVQPTQTAKPVQSAPSTQDTTQVKKQSLIKRFIAKLFGKNK